MDPRDPTAGGGVEVNAYNNKEQQLLEGLETGFKTIMDKLSEINNQIQVLPEQTAKALSGQPPNGVNVKAREGKRQDVTEAMNELMTANRRLESERSQLENRIELATQEMAASTAREIELKNQLFDLKRDIARRELKEVQFRDIIISNAATQQITDRDVINAFVELRQTVQQLAKNQAFDLAQKPLLPPPDSKNQANKHFYSVVRDLSSKDISYRVRMRIWEILHRLVLSRPIFGLKSRYILEEEKSNHEGVKDMWDIETHLARFEGYLSKDAKVNESLITDWRVCTLQCIGAMEIPEEYSEYVAEEIGDFFDPLISKGATTAQKDELWDKMVDVCRKAVALKLMMQRSKEGYYITTINVKECSLYPNFSHIAESMGVEGGKTPDASDDMAYVLFGALLKFSKSTDLGDKVLVKAEVILKKRS